MTANIENFDLLTAKLFAALYESFPVPVALTAEQYGVDVDSAFDFADPVSVDPAAFKALDFFCATVRWLEAYGYLTYQSETNGGFFFDASLTAKGLEVLKATPASLSSTKTLGEYIVEGTKGGVKEAMSKGVSYALSAGAALVLNTALTAVR